MDWLNQSSKLEKVGVIAGVVGAAAAVAAVVWAIYTSTSPETGVRGQVEARQGVAAGRDVNVGGDIRLEEKPSQNQ